MLGPRKRSEPKLLAVVGEDKLVWAAVAFVRQVIVIYAQEPTKPRLATALGEVKGRQIEMFLLSIGKLSR